MVGRDPDRAARYRELRRLKVSERLASAAIFSPKGPWRLSAVEALHRAFTKARFARLGTVECAASQRRRAPGRPVTLSAKLLARALDKAPYLAGRLSRDPHGFRVGARSRSISSRM